jgi:hypothetical protein
MAREGRRGGQSERSCNGTLYFRNHGIQTDVPIIYTPTPGGSLHNLANIGSGMGSTLLLRACPGGERSGSHGSQRQPVMCCAGSYSGGRV